MKKQTLIVTAAALALALLNGCTIVGVSDGDYEDTGYYEEVQYEENYYVDAYVALPKSVRMLIADKVSGYSMPQVSRYGTTLYPLELHDNTNLPSYVSDDFNGDGIYDYACMFSNVAWVGREWHLTTKLIIVTSTPDGYALSTDVVLGEVVGDNSTPVEEYWGIRLLNPGKHSVIWYDNNHEYSDIISLSYAGIYLASIDPDERSVWYAEGNDIYETTMDMGVVAKKKCTSNDARAKRVIRVAEVNAGKTALKQ